MYRLSFTTLLLFAGLFNSGAQTDTILPTLKNGMDFRAFINSQLVYPEIAQENGIQGKVIISFQVTREGCLDSVKVLASPDLSLSRATIKALEKTDCGWNPGRIGDRPVMVGLSFPVTFNLGPGPDTYTSLEKAEKDPQHVRYLVLIGKDYERFPSEIFQFKRLSNLEIDSTKITAVPDSITELNNLSVLILQSDSIRTVTSEIRILSKLFNLDLSDNLLEELPDGIVQMNHLEFLDLSKNQLSALPEGMKGMTRLRELDLSNNRFEKFPMEVLSLKKLDNLILDNNNIPVIPEEISSMHKLHYLVLTGNPLSGDEIKKLKALLPNVKIKF